MNELNDFDCRFDTHDFCTERNSLTESLISIAGEGQEEALTVTEDEVLRVLRGTNPNKPADLIILNRVTNCADELSSILCIMFNLSLFQCKIPETWKMSFIVPVPKKAYVIILNDHRPSSCFDFRSPESVRKGCFKEFEGCC